MYSSTLSLTSALDGGWWSKPHPGRVPYGKRPGTRCTGGWVAPKAGMVECGKTRPPPGFDPQTVQSLASRYTY